MRQLHDEPDELRDRMRARAREVADDLLGTGNKTLNNEATVEEVNNTDFCETLDQLVLECEQCGWWVESDEVCENGRCDDCCKESCDKNEHEDEEDGEDGDEEDGEGGDGDPGGTD